MITEIKNKFKELCIANGWQEKDIIMKAEDEAFYKYPPFVSILSQTGNVETTYEMANIIRIVKIPFIVAFSKVNEYDTVNSLIEFLSILPQELLINNQRIPISCRTINLSDKDTVMDNGYIAAVRIECSFKIYSK